MNRREFGKTALAVAATTAITPSAMAEGLRITDRYVMEFDADKSMVLGPGEMHFRQFPADVKRCYLVAVRRSDGFCSSRTVALTEWDGFLEAFESKVISNADATRMIAKGVMLAQTSEDFLICQGFMRKHLDATVISVEAL